MGPWKSSTTLGRHGAAGAPQEMEPDRPRRLCCPPASGQLRARALRCTCCSGGGVGHVLRAFRACCCGGHGGCLEGKFLRGLGFSCMILELWSSLACEDVCYCNRMQTEVPCLVGLVTAGPGSWVSPATLCAACHAKLHERSADRKYGGIAGQMKEDEGTSHQQVSAYSASRKPWRYTVSHIAGTPHKWYQVLHRESAGGL